MHQDIIKFKSEIALGVKKINENFKLAKNKSEKQNILGEGISYFSEVRQKLLEECYPKIDSKTEIKLKIVNELEKGMEKRFRFDDRVTDMSWKGIVLIASIMIGIFGPALSAVFAHILSNIGNQGIILIDALVIIFIILIIFFVVSFVSKMN